MYLETFSFFLTRNVAHKGPLFRCSNRLFPLNELVCYWDCLYLGCVGFQTAGLSMRGSIGCCCSLCQGLVAETKEQELQGRSERSSISGVLFPYCREC